MILFARSSNEFPSCHSNLDIGNVIGQGVGVDSGYTVAKYMLYPKKYQSEFLPFFDLRFVLSNRGFPGGSLGFGARFQKQSLPFIGGVNIYYDFRFYGNRFNSTVSLLNQIGVGFEILQFYGFDLTLNGYFPVERRKTVADLLFDHYSDGYYIRRRPMHFPQTGGALTLGRAVSFTDVSGGNFSIEGYVYNGEGCHFRTYCGGKGKVSLFFKAIQGGVSLSYDHIFRTLLQGEIGICIPIGCEKGAKNKWGKKGFVQRNDNIFIRDCSLWNWNYTTP